MSDLRQFGRRMRVLANQLEAGVSELTKNVALRVHHEVVMDTPVDKGTARSNWMVTLNHVASGTIPSLVPGTSGSTRGRVAQESILRGLVALDTYRAGDTVFITNNLDYIQALNRGWSPQAAPRYVQRAVETGVALVRSTRVMVTNGN